LGSAGSHSVLGQRLVSRQFYRGKPDAGIRVKLEAFAGLPDFPSGSVGL
jgi:hypothetical protein